jgi:formylglycine-generating enzyme required for sulfatase activity
VVGVVPEGPAHRAGIVAGDILLELDGRPFRFGTSLVARIQREEPGATAELTLLRGGQPRKVTVVLGENDGLRDGKERDDERPLHEVTLNDFFLGRLEVTQAEWERVMGSNPSRRKGARLPVDGVLWEEAKEFARRLSEKSGRRYRLPTEAEWEYAARAGGRNGRWPGTSAGEELGRHAWFAANSGDVTHPVGEKLPNALGLHDMAGNVAEWCADWYQRTHYTPVPARNPAGPPTGEENLWYEKDRHVVRGGSFRSDAWDCRASSRAVQAVEGISSDDTGFRLVMEAP